MTGYRLVRINGAGRVEVWPVASNRPVLLGRGGPAVTPDVDLWPDERVSRAHAELVHADGAWWARDLGSKNGTRVAGQPLVPGACARVEINAEIVVGNSVLRLVSPHWHRLCAGDLAIELELAPAISSALLHWRPTAVVKRLVVQNRGTVHTDPRRLRLAVAEAADSDDLLVPALAPGASHTLVPPAFRLDSRVETLIERARRSVSVWLDGVRLDETPLDCWVLAHNEWLCVPEQWLALAAFVQPNHPLVAASVLDAAPPEGWDASAATTLAALYEHFAERWRLDYRLEPPHWDSGGQKVRLPHQVLLDPSGRRGEGTCLDLALLFAACLERVGWQPLVAVLDLGDWQHALVGCWREPGVRLQSLHTDKARLLEEACWLEATGCARSADDPALHLSCAEAREAGPRLLHEQPLVFALDIAAAREMDAVRPLPFAGEPHHSEAVERALAAARDCAAAVPTRLSTVPLLIGLLASANSLTRDLFAHHMADVDGARERLQRLLPVELPTPPPSQNYAHILALARGLAHVEGSPLLLERHLLRALVDTPNVNLDKALRHLGLDRDLLREELRRVQTSGDARQSSHYLCSEFPTQV